MSSTYKTIYEKKTGKKVPPAWHIHHIDCNRENNVFENLIALPKELHVRYHQAFSKFNGFIQCYGQPTYLLNLFNFQFYNNDEFAKLHYELSQIMKECEVYILFRESLVGRYAAFKTPLYL